MQIYTGIISKDISNKPDSNTFSLKDYVKVRIPHFHGTKTSYPYTLLSTSIAENIANDEELPWAVINRTLDNKAFSAEEFNEDDLVYVLLENNNVNKPIILGYASRFSYTEDPDTAQANATGANDDSVGTGSDHSSFSGASDVVAFAKKQLGRNGTIFLNEYGLSSGTAWCAAFVQYCFKYTGNAGLLPANTFSTNAIYNYFAKNDKTRIITSGYKSGDVLLTGKIGARDKARNGGSDGRCENMCHTCLAIEDEASDGSVRTINGNWGGLVKEDTHKGNQICYGITFGDLITNSTSGDVETQIYNTAKSWGLNNAAACAILANINAESSFNPTNSTLDTNNKTSYGLCQWNGGRFNSLKSYCMNHNLVYSSVSGQLSYLKYELEHSYSSTWSYLQTTPNTAQGAYDAAFYWAEHFEVCASRFFDSRGKSAKNTYWPQYSKKK